MVHLRRPAFRYRFGLQIPAALAQPLVEREKDSKGVSFAQAQGGVEQVRALGCMAEMYMLLLGCSAYLRSPRLDLLNCYEMCRIIMCRIKRRHNTACCCCCCCELCEPKQHCTLRFISCAESSSKSMSWPAQHP